MPKIFISYRREDNPDATGRIYDRLETHFGSDATFMDVDTIPYGVDFVEYLDAAVSECDVLLAVIGERWLEARFCEGPRKGQRRLDDPDDFVRIEICSALSRRIPVIPVLVGQASMPSASELPDELQAFARRNAAEVRSGRDFHDHVNRLIRGLQKLSGKQTAASRTVARTGRATERRQAKLEAEANQAEPTLGHAMTEAQETPRLAKKGRDHSAAARATPAKFQPALAITPFDADAARKHQENWAAYSNRQVVVTNSIGMQLVLIPPGEFLMGSPNTEEERLDNEGPRHPVVITRLLYLGVCPVTQAEYERVMSRNPSSCKDNNRLPVEKVSWQDATEFCRRLSALEEERQAGREYRLPTEAEWEYACRAGTMTRYCFGNGDARLADYAWYDQSSEGKTHVVCNKLPNAWGLHDTHGNVWEWCADWYGRYSDGSVEDPTGPAQGSSRVVRGGGWFHSANYLRSAARSRLSPSERSTNLGFRVALVPSSK